MLTRATLAVLALLTIIFPAYSQSESSVEALLKPLDFSSIVVGVANAKKGQKSASSFVDVYGGVRILSVADCTITFRNEGVDKGRRFVYDAVVPLSMLNEKSYIGEAAGGIGPPGYKSNTDWYGWSVNFDVRQGRRSVVLHDRVRKRVLARGAHVTFRVRTGEEAKDVAEKFSHAILICRNGLPPSN